MALLTPIPLASVPVPGLPPSAIDALGTADRPARFTKPSSYGAVEVGFGGTGSGSYAVYKYWPGSKSWRPEGPRGATPTTVDMSTVAGSVPVRISTEAVECDLCLVLCSGTGIVDGGEFAHAVFEMVGQNR